MTRILKALSISAATLLLAACAESGHKDYDAQRYCEGVGQGPGTPNFSKCVSDEKMHRAMEQQQLEYERVKQQQQDQRMWTR